MNHATRLRRFCSATVLYRDCPPAFVAIPVRNEAERIDACLAGLVGQDLPDPVSVLLLMNNCTDSTVSVVARWLAHPRLQLHLENVWFVGGRGSAGTARSDGMRR